MKFLFWLVLSVVLLVGGLFAIANREMVSVDFWPFWTAASMPLFIALAGTLYLGMAIGALLAWIGGRKTRARARAEHRRAEVLATENAALQARLDKLAPRPQPAIVDLTPAPVPPPAPPLPPAWTGSDKR
jgi:lipopolysaccharide assembly protein A